MKNLKSLIIVVSLFFGVNCAMAQTMEDAQAKYASAMELVKAKSFGEAAAQLEDAMNVGFDLGDEGLDIVKEIQKLLPKVYFYDGVGNLKTKNYDVAIKQLTNAYELGDLYGDITTSRQASRAISGTYQQIGAEAFNAKDYQTALESFSKGYEQDPSNISLALMTGKTYAELGQLETAIEVYNGIIEAGAANSKFEDQAIEAQNDITTYVMIAASEAAEAKNLDEVIRLAELAPTSPEVALMTLQVANNLKKYDVIFAKADAAAELQSDAAVKSDIYYMLGVAYNNTGNFDKAIAALSKVTAGNNAAAAKALVAELKK